MWGLLEGKRGYKTIPSSVDLHTWPTFTRILKRYPADLKRFAKGDCAMPFHGANSISYVEVVKSLVFCFF
jgi:hypothetical protein